MAGWLCGQVMPFDSRNVQFVAKRGKASYIAGLVAVSFVLLTILFIWTRFLENWTGLGQEVASAPPFAQSIASAVATSGPLGTSTSAFATTSRCGILGLPEVLSNYVVLLPGTGGNYLPLETVCDFTKDIGKVVQRDGSYWKPAGWTEVDSVDYDLKIDSMKGSLLASFAFSKPDQTALISKVVEDDGTQDPPETFLAIVLPYLTHVVGSKSLTRKSVE